MIPKASVTDIFVFLYFFLYFPKNFLGINIDNGFQKQKNQTIVVFKLKTCTLTPQAEF